MITKNNKTYVEKGSSEDNGTYNNLYYQNTVTDSTTILYEGQKALLTTYTTVYIDVNTDQIILKDKCSWTIQVGSNTKTGTCKTDEDELYINDLKNSYVPDKDNNTSLIDDITNILGTINNYTYNNNKASTAIDNSDDNNTRSVLDNTTTTDNNITNDTNNSNLSSGSDLAGSGVIEENYTDKEISTIRENNFSNKGTTYPIIRINDHYFYNNEITYFSMETGYYKDYTEYVKYGKPIKGFIPTMKLIVTSSNQGVLKQDHVKQGDRCSVFFTSNHSMVKSMRCDFRITNVVTNKLDLNRNAPYVTQIISGELYVPDLRNEEIRYNFNGSSRDAMMDAAKRLRLSFFFSDPDDTDDVMVWCNCKNMETFILDLTVHAWKNADAFYESWLDPRYGLSFQNMNRLLGEDGFDEPLDATLWVNTFINSRAIDGKSIEKSDKEKVKTDKPLAKILTNIPNDDESATVYHVNKWRLINNALEIQDFVGLNCKMQYESVNPGMDGNSNYSVDFSLCLNRTKFDPEREDNDFYVLLGPARNTTYASADNIMGVSETQSSNRAEPEKVVNQLSDGDALNILISNNNMLSSGNTHRFFEVAFEHNMRNLLLLQKQYIDVELNGANLTIVRGEKLPIMLMDLNRANSIIRQADTKTKVQELIYEAESGWYIIDGIEWVFDPQTPSETGTNWRTNVRLVRREWPIPGKDKQVDGNLSDVSKQLVYVNIGNGNMAKLAYVDAITKYGKDAVMGMALDEVVVTANKVNKNTTSSQGTLYTEKGSETVSSDNFNLDILDQYVTAEDKVNNTEIPLTGLKQYMKDIYRAIEEASNNNVKLVSARRWAVDENGNKVNGNAYIKKYDYYKCMNAIGEIMYFKSNNSKHLYGEAFDIINNGSDFTSLMTNIIMKNGNILRLMYDNGVSAYIEQSKDDTGTTTKHYHIGTDTIKQREFWASVKAVLGSDKIPGTNISFSNYMRFNITGSSEITRTDIDENTIKGED